MDTNNHIEQLEAYAFGRMSPEEAARLEARLKAEPELQAEADGFLQLWSGFELLQTDHLREQMNRWESEWSHIADDELAEWYWLGGLSPENRAAVEARAASEANFATLLSRQETLSSGLAAAGREDFRRRMTSWDQEDETTRPKRRLRTLYIRRLAAAAAIALLIFFGGSWYADQQYGDEALAGRYYQPPATGGTMGAESGSQEAFNNAFSAAHQALDQGDYLTAASRFDELSNTIDEYDLSAEDRRYYLDNVEWNEVLSLLGGHQLNGYFNSSLDRIADNDEHTYQAEAKDLRTELGSFWRRW